MRQLLLGCACTELVSRSINCSQERQAERRPCARNTSARWSQVRSDQVGREPGRWFRSWTGRPRFKSLRSHEASRCDRGPATLALRVGARTKGGTACTTLKEGWNKNVKHKKETTTVLQHRRIDSTWTVIVDSQPLRVFPKLCFCSHCLVGELNKGLSDANIQSPYLNTFQSTQSGEALPRRAASQTIPNKAARVHLRLAAGL